MHEERGVHVTQCQKPAGWLGRWVLRNMNSRHSGVTDWGLSHVVVGDHDTVLDIGCGGGRTISKLAAVATQGNVVGVDYSAESVAVATKLNKRWIDLGRVKIQEGSVSQLPFSSDFFDLITAVETHFWWPDLQGDIREVIRVLKPGGTLVVIAEIYKGAPTRTAKLAEKYLPLSGMKLLTVEEHRALLESAGFSNVRIAVKAEKGWICCVGMKAGAPNQAPDIGFSGSLPK